MAMRIVPYEFEEQHVVQKGQPLCPHRAFPGNNGLTVNCMRAAGHDGPHMDFCHVLDGEVYDDPIFTEWDN